MKYCFNCGAELVIKGSKFCYNCGQDLRIENLDLEDENSLLNSTLSSDSGEDPVLKGLNEKFIFPIRSEIWDGIFGTIKKQKELLQM